MHQEEEDIYDRFEVSSKKDKIKKAIIGELLLTVVLCIIAINWFSNAKGILFDNPMDYYELASSGGLYNNRYVTLHVHGVLAAYAEANYIKDPSVPDWLLSNINLGDREQYFALWMENNDIISLKASDEELIEQLNERCEETLEYLDAVSAGERNAFLKSKEITINGVITSMDEDVKEYYERFLRDIGMEKNDPRVHYKEVDTIATRTDMILASVCMIVIVVPFVVTAVILLKKWRYL